MTYATLMVHLDGSHPNASVLEVTAAIAKRHDAKVIGIAACQPIPLGACDGYMDGTFAMLEQDIVTDELSKAKAESDTHIGLQSQPRAWRSIPTLENVAHIIARQARCADLLITGVGPTPRDAFTHADTGDLILRAGRPVLVVPDANVTADFKNIVIAWTDTRESRRAVNDALPMLRCADRVTIVEATTDPAAAQAGIGDVVDWLGRHTIAADRIDVPPHGAKADTLAAIVSDVDADLVVAGAYGHSRIREWIFGGVTRDFLLHERRCTLLSH